MHKLVLTYRPFIMFSQEGFYIHKECDFAGGERLLAIFIYHKDALDYVQRKANELGVIFEIDFIAEKEIKEREPCAKKKKKKK